MYPGEPRPSGETAYLRIPGPITVEKIDGKDLDVPSKADGFYDIYLLPGLHRIDFKYELYWGDPVSGMVVTSDVIGVETRFNAGMTYELIYPKPESEEDAYWMAQKFSATLVESDTGRRVASRTTDELNERGVRTTLVYKTDSDPLPNSEPVYTAENTSNIKAPKGIDADTAVREDAVKRLKFWWLMADEEEKVRFRKWMETLENNSPQAIE